MSIDVISLYTKGPQTYHRRKPLLPSAMHMNVSITTSFQFRRMLRVIFILQENSFQFNGEHYVKIGFLNSKESQKWILLLLTKQLNPRYFASWCVKGTEESTSRMDSSVPLTHHDRGDLELICLVKKYKIKFSILSDLKIRSWIFLKKRTLRWRYLLLSCSWQRLRQKS